MGGLKVARSHFMATSCHTDRKVCSRNLLHLFSYPCTISSVNFVDKAILEVVTGGKEVGQEMKVTARKKGRWVVLLS